jgi:cobalt transporter subunit CbtA
MPLSGRAGAAAPVAAPKLGALNRIAVSALLGGVLSGLLLTAIQQWQVIPIIEQAEVYERAAAGGHGVPAGHSHSQDGHSHVALEQDPHPHEHQHELEHEHEHAASQAVGGFARSGLTALANVAMGVGFALLLGALLCLRDERRGWKRGLLYGGAAYAVFFAAPSLGLPPELPGTAAAPLADRQLWWIATAALTAGGIATLAYAAVWQVRVLGIALLCIPHAIGAPQIAVHAGVAPAALAESFVYATAIANAAFWLALGALTAAFYRRFG